jgi:hypothetical protein
VFFGESFNAALVTVRAGWHVGFGDGLHCCAASTYQFITDHCIWVYIVHTDFAARYGLSGHIYKCNSLWFELLGRGRTFSFPNLLDKSESGHWPASNGLEYFVAVAGCVGIIQKKAHAVESVDNAFGRSCSRYKQW